MTWILAVVLLALGTVSYGVLANLLIQRKLTLWGWEGLLLTLTSAGGFAGAIFAVLG